MTYLTAGDWILIGAYLAGIVAFGLWCGRSQTSTRDYFLGNRSIAWWGVGLSIVATETSALTFIGVPALAFGGDLTFIQIVAGYVLARLILAVVLVPHYFKGDIYSPYQLFADAFGPRARYVASAFFLVAGTLAAGVRVYVTCIPIDLMLGEWLTRWFGHSVIAAIVLFVLLSLAYTWLGGIKSVVWTDAVQFVLLLGGGVFALAYLPTLIDGGWDTIARQAAQADKWRWFNGKFSLSLPFNIWMGFLGATVMVMSTHGADQLVVQRVLACRSVRDGRKALVLSAVIIFPLMLIFLLVGMLLWVYYSQTAPIIPLPESQAGFQKNDYIFPVFILTATPPLFKGLLIVAILSAAMSSVSSALSALASVTVMDLIPARPGANPAQSDRRRLQWSRGATIFWGVMLIAVAIWSRHVTSVLNWALTLSGLTNGALLGGLFLALRQRASQNSRAHASPAPVIAGMLVSLAGMIAISQWSWTETVDGVEVARKVGWPWFTLIGTCLTLLAAGVTRRLIRH